MQRAKLVVFLMITQLIVSETTSVLAGSAAPAVTITAPAATGQFPVSGGLFSGTATAILDEAYRHHLMVMVTVVDLTPADVTRIVNAYYKDHPALLGWIIGNEWNLNLFHRYAGITNNRLARKFGWVDFNAVGSIFWAFHTRVL